MTITGITIDTDGTIALVELGSDNIEHMYKLIDCRIFDCVRVNAEVDIWVDDEGLLVASPVPNPIASNLTDRPLFGHALMLRRTPHGETASLLPEDLERLLPGAMIIGPAFTPDEIATARDEDSWFPEGKGIYGTEVDELKAMMS